ncbi:galactokinase [Rhodococcus sp. PAMC28707]|uniref:galactokinase n=1 Tax=unclassified Rhodococcus (in: high G+C Gram-positive bacteria) TaxID=192944 RepID=UPI00109D9EA1|nr:MULTISPECIES: galactokinase [unclassified Rhodococcus (in: high G+C Gram-positive bacteria)]QCB52076.1 galactokinase [Rhodococcus sp. PAMC28705]QCB59756.1 galactokinase [Rhodococcus sp. PAMC28707]
MNVVVARAPGRINLIGEHTDYNQGFAMPIALEERTTVRFEPDGSDVITVRSTRESIGSTFAVHVQPGEVDGWSSYPAGVVWALRAAGHPVVGGTMSVTSDVPIGAGLSSSAALECAVLLAITAATGTDLDLLEVALVAQRAENEFVGAPTGLMDQLASLHGEVDRALLIDFEDFSVSPVVFDLASHGLSLLVINSNAAHHHSTGEYASRRESCTRAAAVLGVESLRDVQGREGVLDRIDDPTDRCRVRHVLSENQRVLDCAEALTTGDFRRVGELMTQSHASMRDDFEITTLNIDLIVESAVRHGALGARMTGGGFGGCVIAVVPAADAAAITTAVEHDVVAGGHPAPTTFTGQAGAGASWYE